MSQPAIPIVLCGKNPAIAKPFSDEMKDGGKFQVIHVCHSLDTAIDEIPRLIRGETVQSKSEVASSTNIKDQQSASTEYSAPTSAIPRVVMFGKGFARDEMQQIIDHCSAIPAQTGGVSGKQVAYLTPDDSQMGMGGMFAAMATNAVKGRHPVGASVADRVKVCLEKHGIVPGSAVPEDAGVFGF